MKLYATDQVSISSVQADTLKVGQEFEVSDDYGEELLKKLPHAVSTTAPKGKAEPAAPKNKAEPKLQNKADPLDHDKDGKKGGSLPKSEQKD